MLCAKNVHYGNIVEDRIIASNNSKYSEEIRERTARHIIENGKSVTATSEEPGIIVHKLEVDVLMIILV